MPLNCGICVGVYVQFLIKINYAWMDRSHWWTIVFHSAYELWVSQGWQLQCNAMQCNENYITSFDQSPSLTFIIFLIGKCIVLHIVFPTTFYCNFYMHYHLAMRKLLPPQKHIDTMRDKHSMNYECKSYIKYFCASNEEWWCSKVVARRWRKTTNKQKQNK